MTEEDIKRIEKKVDLLYKILLNLEVESVGYPYDFKYMSQFYEDLIPLFNLSPSEDLIKIPDDQEVKKSKESLKKELEKLQKDYDEGNYIAKEKGNLEEKIDNIHDKLDGLSTITEIQEEAVEVNQKVKNILVLQSLKSKFGLTRKYPYILNISSDLLKYLHSADLTLQAAGPVNIQFISTD
jgi:hypothetical protein